MPSRMSRYYGGSRTAASRSEKNEHLYKTLYQTNDYSNISAVATLDKTNEIEIDKIRKMIRDRETYKKQRELANIYPKEEKQERLVQQESIFDEKTYDIRDVLSKAKEERKTNQDELYKKNNYEYLLNSKAYNQKKESTDFESTKRELKEIINTITDNADLNKLSSSELSLDLLKDLKSNTITDGKIEDGAIRKIIEEERKRKEKIESEDNIEMDKSFYTTNLHFSNKDFEDEEDTINSIRKAKGNLVIKIGLGILLTLITLITIYVVYINITSI